MVRNLFAIYLKSSRQNLFIYFCIFYSYFVYQAKPRLKLECSRGQRVPVLGKESNILTELSKCNIDTFAIIQSEFICLMIHYVIILVIQNKKFEGSH